MAMTNDSMKQVMQVPYQMLCEAWSAKGNVRELKQFCEVPPQLVSPEGIPAEETGVVGAEVGSLTTTR
jgi:hypothetical protein